jgi:hypothetical protein
MRGAMASIPLRLRMASDGIETAPIPSEEQSLPGASLILHLVQEPPTFYELFVAPKNVKGECK